MNRPEKKQINFAFAWAFPSSIFLSCVALGQIYTISTVVGGSPAATPATATSYYLRGPYGVVADGAGNVYFTTQLNCIFKLSPDGTLSAFTGCARGYSGDGGPALSAQFSVATGLAMDNSGNLYVADTDNNVIREISANGIVTTVAGNGTAGYSGDSGPALSAQLQYPQDVAVDSAGSLFIADTGNNVVRKVSASGILTTLAGTGAANFGGDKGPAASATLNSPWSVAVDGSGNLFIADYRNSRVREVSAAGVITTVAGNGQRYYDGAAVGDLGPYLGDGGLATNAIIDPFGVRVDSNGNLIITDQVNNRIRRVNASGIISTIAGSSIEIGKKFIGDGGPATKATIDHPWSVAVDPAGNLYIADFGCQRIRKVSIAGTITTIAGDVAGTYNGDGGPAKAAVLSAPFGLTVDSSGNLYIADSGAAAIRKVSQDGTITTIVGGPQPAATALKQPSGVLSAPDGSLYVSDAGTSRVLKVSANGAVSVVAGTGVAGYNGDNIAATSATLTSPQGLALDGSGNLYVADSAGARVRKISANGIISTVAGTGGGGPVSDGIPATTAPLYEPTGIAFDSAGNLYIGEYMRRLRKVTPDGIISTAAGAEFGSGDVVGDGGPATTAYLRFFNGWVAIDTADNIYLSEGPPAGYDLYGDGNNRIRKVSPDGTISTVAGFGPAGYTGDGGPATKAAIQQPLGITIDGKGNIYFVDQGNFLGSNLFALYSLVRVLTPSAPPALLTISTPVTLPPGTVGIPYSASLAASGGWPPVTWTLMSGSLPPGTTLSKAGMISGIPTNAGTFQFTIQVADSSASTAAQEFALTMGDAPVISAIVSAASALPGAIAPGEVVVIHGANLGLPQLSSLTVSAAGLVGTELAGTTVMFGSHRAPVIYSSSTAVAVVIPYEVTGASVSATLSYKDQASPAFALKVVPATPAMFTADSSGSGQVAALNADGSLNSAAHPAAAGTTVTLYVTGEGQTSPAAVDGKVSEPPYAAPLLPVTMSIGGITCVPSYAAAAPDMVSGVMQVKVAVPSGLSGSGPVGIRVTVGSAVSPPGTTIFIAAP